MVYLKSYLSLVVFFTVLLESLVGRAFLMKFLIGDEFAFLYPQPRDSYDSGSYMLELNLGQHTGFFCCCYCFFIIDWWTWNAGLCIYQANAVVLGFTHILNFQIWQRVSFFSLKKAISESLDDRCVTIFLPTLFILNLLEQIWVFYMYACLYTTYVCSPSSYKITSEPHKWVNG